MDKFFFFWFAGTCRCGGKTIFEDDFQRLTDPTYAILKIVKDIDNYTNHPFKTH
jgi:hypothetical protein